jgi:hypothetical protein
VDLNADGTMSNADVFPVGTPGAPPSVGVPGSVGIRDLRDVDVSRLSDGDQLQWSRDQQLWITVPRVAISTYRHRVTNVKAIQVPIFAPIKSLLTAAIAGKFVPAAAVPTPMLFRAKTSAGYINWGAGKVGEYRMHNAQSSTVHRDSGWWGTSTDAKILDEALAPGSDWMIDLKIHTSSGGLANITMTVWAERSDNRVVRESHEVTYDRNFTEITEIEVVTTSDNEFIELSAVWE